MTKRWWWVPIRACQTGFARIESYSAEQAIDAVEDGDFIMEDAIAVRLDSVEVVGAPIEEEVN